MTEDQLSLPGVGPCSGRCLDHPEHVYILCYGRPTVVSDRDYLPDDPTLDYPITHYVGYTRQQPPLRRIWSHGARSAHYIAQIRPGTGRRFKSCQRRPASAGGGFSEDR